MMILSNCIEFRQLMTVLSHSKITKSHCYFSSLANEGFFFLLLFFRRVFAETQASLFFVFLSLVS